MNAHNQRVLARERLQKRAGIVLRARFKKDHELTLGQMNYALSSDPKIADLKRRFLGFSQDVDWNKEAEGAARRIGARRAGRYSSGHELWELPGKKGTAKPRTASRAALSDAIVAQLGKVPDGELAGRARTTAAAIARARRKAGIPPVKRERAWLTPKIRALLGTVADREVAEKAHVSVGTIARARRQLGIAGFCGCAPPSMFGARKRR